MRMDGIQSRAPQFCNAGRRCVILVVVRPVPRWFVAVCGGLAVLFSLSVGLQFNDPDPAIWIAIYGAAAIACALLPARRLFMAGAIGVGLVAAAWGGYLIVEVADQLEPSDLWLKMSEKGGAVEVGREAGGLVIVAVSLLVLSGFRARRA
jgi:Transmembrane family 220, helix